MSQFGHVSSHLWLDSGLRISHKWDKVREKQSP